MRELKFHEKKLLKKTDFYDWKNISSLKKSEIVRKYRLKSRTQYSQYEKIVGLVTRMGSLLQKLPETSEFRKMVLTQLLNKLFETGILTSKEGTEKTLQNVSVSKFVRRRLLVILKSLKFVETLKEAQTYIEQGHIMIGNDVICDADFLVSRMMEDHISWNDKSKIKRKVQRFNNKEDDFELY